MEIDLSEYEQFDEIKFLSNKDLNHQDQRLQQGSSLVVTLSSSSSEQTSGNDDTNCENDYVFLPSPPTHLISQNQEQATIAKTTGINRKADLKLSIEPSQGCVANSVVNATKKQHQQQHPLMTINSNGSGNPFYSIQQQATDEVPQATQMVSQQPSWLRPISETLMSKPIGLLDFSTNMPTSSDQVLSLMQQIVTRSDTIHIAIPCDYCLEPIACPPSDISAWLNHMSRQHHCKVCPICNKLVGLGPRGDPEVMRKHVITHFDDAWFQRRPTRTSFTHGLQQNWYSGNRCSIKEPRTLGTLHKRN